MRLDIVSNYGALAQLIERSIITTHRKRLWTPFMLAVKRYDMISRTPRAT